jgi:hypothetical protein
MGNRDLVVIELDSAPSVLNVPTSGDYLERCVVSALFRPALRLVAASSESNYFEFVVEDGHCFSDGLPVQATHVLATLVASATSLQWARHIAYLEKAQIVGDRLCLNMRRPARFYPDMLRTVDFAPTHPDGRLGHGPYRIGADYDPEHGYYHLTPNPHMNGSDGRPELVFRLQKDIDGAPDRFVRGESDITCSTAFPLDRLDEWRGSDALHQAPTGIYMQIEPNPSGEGTLADPSLRRAMLGCLDLATIAASFPGGLRPASCPVVSVQPEGASIPSQLRISYHDFYPNRSVLEELSLQWWDRLGIRIELVERDYADWKEDDADASFVLRYLPFDHPYAYFDQCATLLADKDFDRLVQRFAAGDEESGAVMDRHVQSALPMIRVFEVIGNWLSSPDVSGFSWPSDAVFDFTRLRRLDGGR